MMSEMRWRRERVSEAYGPEVAEGLVSRCVNDEQARQLHLKIFGFGHATCLHREELGVVSHSGAAVLA